MTFRSELVVRESLRTGWWLLQSDLVYEGKTDCWTIPAGFATDFASVPDSLVWLVNKTGAYTKAAIVHDWLIVSEISTRRVTSRDTDGIFRRIMREEGVDFKVRWIMWAAVRAASLFSPHRSYGRAFWKDASLVFLIAILSLPFVPAALLVFITRFLLHPTSTKGRNAT